MRQSLKVLAAAAALSMAAVAQASVVVVTKDASSASSVPGFSTTFQSSGASLEGLTVTASFSNGLVEELVWTSFDTSAGGVVGTGWGLSVSGETFSSAWDFTIDDGANLGNLTSLKLDGTTSKTVFDTAAPSPGTPGSEDGSDFAFGTCAECEVEAIYSNAVFLGTDAPLNDLFRVLTLQFREFDDPLFGTILYGPTKTWSFRQDTDLDSTYGTDNEVPEPGSLALAGVALLGAGLARRRRV
jgi:PEP-CTERM motif